LAALAADGELGADVWRQSISRIARVTRHVRTLSPLALTVEMARTMNSGGTTLLWFLPSNAMLS